MHNAIPAHGQSKQVERFFEVFKENFSKFIPTYTGGKPHERPESLDKLMEDSGNIPLLSYINKLLCDYIEGEYNVSPSQAKGLNGMTPNECYGDNLFEKRVAREDDLNILMLRTERLQTVQRNGVKLLVSGETVWYYSTELILDWQGKKVFVKYDPDNLDTVRVYDEKERFIMTAEISRKGGYSFDSGVCATLSRLLFSPRPHRRKLSLCSVSARNNKGKDYAQLFSRIGIKEHVLTDDTTRKDVKNICVGVDDDGSFSTMEQYISSNCP